VHRSQYSLPAPVVRTADPFEQYKAYLVGAPRRRRPSRGHDPVGRPLLRLNQRAMELDRAQRPSSSGGNFAPPSFGPYLTRHITSLADQPRAKRLLAHWGNLSRIQAQYGVDPAVIIAIYGKETSYGTVTGSFDLLEALASLGYEGRRRAFFEDEFIAALKLLDQGRAALAAQRQLCRSDRLSAVHADRGAAAARRRRRRRLCRHLAQRERCLRVHRQLFARRRVEEGRAVGACR
jgi:hypothetical protein